MSTVEQKLWPWQLIKKRSGAAKLVRFLQAMTILGICIGLPVGVISAMPFADALIRGLMPEATWGLWGGFASAIVRGILLVVVVLSGVAYGTLAERRFAGLIQLRKGPNRVGWFGFLQPMADALKFLFKEENIPGAAHKPLFIAAPIIILFPAIAVYAVIPFGPGEVGANLYQIASVDIGMLLVLAFSSIGIYGITIGGWSSGSKWSLLGGIRASAQMISYEVSLGLSITGVFLVTQSFDLVAIANYQIYGDPIFGFLPAWNIFTQGGGFVVFLVAMFAETNRLPFDLAECEQELVVGYHTEYSSMKFASFMLSEYANLITASALISLLFLGGWHVPGLDLLKLPDLVANAIQIFAFCAKIFFFVFLFIWVRWTLPRFRYDQLMKLGWLILLPTALGNLILVAIFTALF